VKTELSDSFYFEHDPETNVLALRKHGSKDSGLFLDFIAGWKSFHRQKVTSSDLLAKAVGMKKGLKIADLTLGLAQDSLKLVYLGAEVTGIEKHPWIFALVENAIERVKNLTAGQKLKIKNGSSLDFVDELLEEHEVFYLDPMFTHKRSALPKKGMQYLAEITGDDDEKELGRLMKKIISSGKRLVVKRALKAPYLAGIEPRRHIDGKMIRFDIYFET
jgi:16S rRNA (guanine1516-N2)-methyltransferase